MIDRRAFTMGCAFAWALLLLMASCTTVPKRAATDLARAATYPSKEEMKDSSKSVARPRGDSERRSSVAPTRRPASVASPIERLSLPPQAVADEMPHAPPKMRPPGGVEEMEMVPDAVDQGEKMPEFPYPPPGPSAFAEIEMDRFQRTDNATLGDLDEQLKKGLKGAGYTEHRYFHFPGGYAVATRLERYKEANWASYEKPDRWVVSDSEIGFSLGTYLRALLTGKAGVYRVIVFTVTDKPYPTDPERRVTEEEATSWLKIGLNALPPAVKVLPWTKDIAVNALIYEFEKREGIPPKVRVPLATGLDHLKGSGILAGLKTPP